MNRPQVVRFVYYLSLLACLKGISVPLRSSSPHLQEEYSKESLLLSKASFLNIFFSFCVCLFACVYNMCLFQLDHITGWFASSIQIIVWSGEWNGYAFTAGVSLQWGKCLEIQSVAQTLWRTHRKTCKYSSPFTMKSNRWGLSVPFLSSSVMPAG